MAKARSRAATRKIKDRWKSKNWYNVIATPAFDNATIATTLTDNPENMINRVTGVSLQDLTNDFRKSHLTLFFKINKVNESNAFTQFDGHTLTSDYVRRSIRRRRSKIDGVYDVTTRDGAVIRVKVFATTDKRIRNSQKKIVRDAMKKTMSDQAIKITFSEFVKNILDGKVGSDIYLNCKKLYPVKRIEIFKTEVISQPTIRIEEKKQKKEEKEESIESKKTEKKEKKKEEPKESKKAEKKEKKKEEPKETKEKDKPAKEKLKKPKKVAKSTKKEEKKKKPKKTEEKTAKPKAKAKKKPAKKQE
jgi:small subunit ribosomal protein S3Ae